MMETNEKKPKRPRISVNRPAEDSDVSKQETQRYERINYNRQENADGEKPQRPQGGYQPRQQGGYNNRYNNQGGYNNGYNRYNNSRYNNNNQDGEYQPRQQQEGGYQPRQQQEGGYQPRQQQEGGYQPRQQQEGGYQPRQQGGYNNRNNGYNRQGGYNNNRNNGYNRQQGGYNNNRQQGGYNNNRQYNNYNRQNQEGGYQPRQQQEGGYQPRQQSGYNNNRGYNNGYNNNRGGYNNNRGGYNNNGYNNRGGFNQGQRPGKSFIPRPKRIEYEMPIPDPNEQIRLNKFLANAGLCSRREADEFIQQGLVKVNGEVVTELGTKISHNDTVEYDEKVVALESKCYILLNKPKDCVTTSDDPNGRLTVMDLVKGACNERIYPVGRLDRNTTGVLLLTNDGDLASKLTHPKYVKKKIYHVWCDKDITEDDMQRIADGIELEDGPIHADAISYATENDRNQAGIEIHSGRNRIVRRIFESLGYHVTKLDRVYFAGLTKKNLPRGRWRYLTQDEVNFLKMGSFE